MKNERVELNYYKIAPTFLYREKESRLFQTQEEVDAAWGDGWYGPPWLTTDKPLISDEDFLSCFGTKQRLVDAVASDPRYGGLRLQKKKTTDELYGILRIFETEAELRGNDGE